MEFKSGDKIKIKNDALYEGPGKPSTFGTSKLAFEQLRGAGTLEIKDFDKSGVENYNYIRLVDNPTEHMLPWVFPAQWFEKVKEINSGDYVTIDKNLKKEADSFGLTDSNWLKAKNDGPWKVLEPHSNFGGHACFYVDYKVHQTALYFPISSMTKVDGPKKEKKEMKKSFKIGDRVTYQNKSTGLPSGRSIGTVTKVIQGLYTVKWDHGYIGKNYATSQIVLATTNERTKESKTKMKFKIGDKVKFKSTKCCTDKSDWRGKITEVSKTYKKDIIRKGKTVNSRAPYKVMWASKDGGPVDSSGTFYNRRNLRPDVSPVVSKRKEEKMSFYSRKKKVLAKKKVAKKKAEEKELDGIGIGGIDLGLSWI